MSHCCTWLRAVAGASLALVAACEPIPNVVDMDKPPPSTEPSCFEGHDGTIAVTFCEEVDQALLQNFLAERWLPPTVRNLRAQSALHYGSDDRAALERASMRARLHNSYLIPHDDSQRDVAGWDLFDSEQRLAMLLLDLEERSVLVYADVHATSTEAVSASLRRFLDAPEPIATRAQKLYAR